MLSKKILTAVLGGELCRPIARTVLLRPNRVSSMTSRNGHDAHISDLRNVRLAFLSEPSGDGDEFLDASCMKLLTGGAELRVRSLYESYRSLRPSWVISY